MIRKNYYEFKDLENLYLEDSYLLDLSSEGGCVSLFILGVLTENHSLYSLPQPNKQYCYRYLKMIFSEAKNINWIRKEMKIIPNDMDFIPDYGNINALFFENGKFHIEGEWGEIEFQSNSPVVKFQENKK